MIAVTKPFLPPIAEYESYLRGIWDRGWLTNHGPLVTELEERLRHFLDVAHLQFVTNGTLALQLALHALEVGGEVITTPFSYVATTSSMIWEQIAPVMVDIDPGTFNINPDLIESAITKQTTAIMAVHVFGNACDIERLERIATRHNLRLIFDAAHAFGARYKGRSLYAYGDISTASFHATKLFHTVEGGAVITADAELARRLSLLRNFGHTSPNDFELAGINGKNSEFHAAMGLCNLPYVPDILARRARLSARYTENLGSDHVQHQAITPGCEYNYAYYPVVFQSERLALTVQHALNNEQIYPRRYFYPSLNRLSFIPRRGHTPVSDSIASRILCLPLYPTLTTAEVDRISQIVLRTCQDVLV